ncbi:NADH dehydrogenase, FAD-containing subunit [Cordyceps militaris CM01]|uniref:NADH dehydrogenase, FAD-containing subunit n=1 Tax=Cordyceps militaris (strain CM01) TaxID=983644 RepID=G3JH29_CORMM|nr:NADH dehydrogenase, FAD-containing subunit [Cordyceps militaris CM01]EGX91585.1 NADH dehydrogenase, FAD-containing subunit [Cordyceps militaris CM01]
MPERILIIGAGFAGLWSALSAQRLIQLRNKQNDVHVVVIAPKPSLVVRPRLYEANPSAMAHDIAPLLHATGIQFLEGIVHAIDPSSSTITYASDTAGVATATLSYDRLVLAAGSSVVRPEGVQGLSAHAFDIDSLASAATLDAHLKSLASLPPSAARDTVVVCGAGFTGIELATELPARLGRHMRIILVDPSDAVGAQLGAGPRPAIAAALAALRDRDALGRVRVDATLRVPSARAVFVTGDAAHAVADPAAGQAALMCCQHALLLGRVAGHNAAAGLVGAPLVDYAQAAYNCCLDLGGHGAVICRGWQRDVMLEGDMAKRVKQYINGTLIYPPTDAAEALAAADPGLYGDSDELFRQMIETTKGAA